MLEYKMSKSEVLEQVFPDEVGFLLDEAQKLKNESFRELIHIYHGDPKANIERLDGRRGETETQIIKTDSVSSEKGTMQLAIWSGNLDFARKVQLYKKANEHSKAVNHG